MQTNSSVFHSVNLRYKTPSFKPWCRLEVPNSACLVTVPIPKIITVSNIKKDRGSIK